MDVFDALEVGNCVVYSSRDQEIIGVWIRGSRAVNFYTPRGAFDWEAIDTMMLGGEHDPSFSEVVMRASAFILNEG